MIKRFFYFINLQWLKRSWFSSDFLKFNIEKVFLCGICVTISLHSLIHVFHIILSFLAIPFLVFMRLRNISNNEDFKDIIFNLNYNFLFLAHLSGGLLLIYFSLEFLGKQSVKSNIIIIKNTICKKKIVFINNFLRVVFTIYFNNKILQV